MKDMMQEIIKKYYINDQEAIIADIDATYMETNKESGMLNYKNEKKHLSTFMQYWKRRRLYGTLT